MENIPDPNKCVGLYVVICYNKAAYPGLVVDAGQSDCIFSILSL
jgi:hypothetical protein